MVSSSCRIHSFLHFFDVADFIFLQEDQGLGHLFQIVAFCPPCIAFALALREFRLNVHQQMERLLFWRLLLMRTVFGFSSNDRLDFIFAVPCAQRPKTDKAFLPCSFDRSVLSSLDLIALLFQLLKKGFKVCGLLVQQDIVDYGAQLIPVAFSEWVKGTLLPFPVRLDFNNRQLMFQTNQIAQTLYRKPGQQKSRNFRVLSSAVEL